MGLGLLGMVFKEEISKSRKDDCLRYPSYGTKSVTGSFLPQPAVKKRRRKTHNANKYLWGNNTGLIDRFLLSFIIQFVFFIRLL